MKLTFGQLDQNPKDEIVEHTAITIPWPQVKILAYLLRVHLISTEANLGRIHLPINAVKEISESIPDDFKGLPKGEAVWKKLRENYVKLVTENPEILGEE
jgi:hypothetical protein